MSTDPSETQLLLQRAKRGDKAAFDELFKRHRTRLRQAIAMRLDRRLAARVDASDVLQEAHLEAFKRLPKYLEKQDMPFYLWLNWIAREKVLAFHRRHIGADKRALGHEVAFMPMASSAQFASGLLGRSPSPSQELARAELAEQLRMALSQLNQDERDLILWRHFERLTALEVAQLLQISEAAASKRYIRALERLRRLLLDLGVSRPR
jgi:RNA polymerase sigma-70 factor (ECF subfamily)